MHGQFTCQTPFVNISANTLIMSLCITDSNSSQSGIKSISSNSEFSSTEQVVQILPQLEIELVNQDVFAGYYFHGKTLAEGLFGKVHLATHLKTFQHVAIKEVLKKRFLDEKDYQAVQSEIVSLKVLRHPNIARLLQLIDTTECVYLIREHCTNGDLYEHVERNGKLSQKESKRILRELISCLHYMHERGFCHCDIRPTNILLDARWHVKLIGFRFAQNFCGTKFNSLFESNTTKHLCPEYLPPEVIAGHEVVCAPAVDVWSSGILLHFILTGTLPFTADNLDQLSTKIQTGMFPFQNDFGYAHELIKQMLQVNPVERIEVKAILRHNWFNGKLRRKMNNNIDFNYDDKLDSNAFNECLLLHGKDTDPIQLRYNIRYSFGYQTASYWLIKENWSQYKALHLKPTRRVINKMNTNCSFRTANHSGINLNAIKDSTSDDYVQNRHTFMPPGSRTSNLSTDDTSDTSAGLSESKNYYEKCTISQKEVKKTHSRESKIRSKLVPKQSIDNRSIGQCAMDVIARDDRLWPTKTKSSFNLRRIFFKSQMSDDRSNLAKSIETNSIGQQSSSVSSSIVATTTTSSGNSSESRATHQKLHNLLKTNLSRRLSFAFPAKLFVRNPSCINSAPTTNKEKSQYVSECVNVDNCYDAIGDKRKQYAELQSRHHQRHQYSSICAITNTSEDDTESRCKEPRPAKTIRYSTIIDPQQEYNQISGQLRWKPDKNTFNRDIFNESNKINSNQCSTGEGIFSPMAAKKCSSVAIITRFDNYEECMHEAERILTRRGINCKPKNGCFVTIKMKKVCGKMEDFHVIATDLTKHFERSHLRRSCYLGKSNIRNISATSQAVDQ